MKSYEILKFLTVKLTASKTSDAEHSTCVATGFYVILNGTPVIVTAKHFAEDTDEHVTITAHYKENNKIISLPVTAYVEWIASAEFDIAYCKVEPFEKKFKEITGHNMFNTALSENNIMTKEEFSQLNILSEVVTLSYPLGSSSTHHSFPLFKKGYISSNPADFTEDGEGYLDLCSECGMSGAPIILNDSPLKLLGILVQNIKSERSLTPSTAIYVSADKILDMK